MKFRILDSKGRVVKTINFTLHNNDDPIGPKPEGATRKIEVDPDSVLGLNLIQISGRGTENIHIDSWPVHRERG